MVQVPLVAILVTMIMVMNYKKCRAMKKFITSILVAAAAFTACSQSEDITINNSEGKVVFSATADAPQSRSVLVEEAGKYHAEWVAGDYLELYEITVTDGTSKKENNPNTTLTEGGKSVKVQFELEAKTADSYIYVLSHNNASMNGAGTYLAFTLPSAQAPTAMNTYDPLADLILSKGVELAAQPTEIVNFEMARVTALAKVTIKNLALAEGDAVKSVIFSCDKPIAGKITKMMISDLVAGNYPLAQSEVATPATSVSVTLPEPQTGDFSYYMSVWPTTLDAGSKCTVTIHTTKEAVYSKEITLPKVMELVSGEITAFTVNMAGIGSDAPVEMPDYVTVAGIKWAMGNLEYELNGTTDENFATGWRIAPSQGHHFYLSGGDVTPGNYEKVAHFNYGGIEDAFSMTYEKALHIAAPAEGGVAFDFSGKMYSDSACAAETTDFAAAKFGDIAYWASNGQYRMPTSSEFETLYAKSLYTLATYNYEGVTVSGTYFIDPAEGETAGLVSGTKTITDEDLAVGLFLPWSGRAYNNTEYNIYKVNAQGFYRTSTVSPNATSTNGYGIIFRVNDHTNLSNTGTKTVNGNTTYNFGSTSRYAIRPIYVK